MSLFQLAGSLRGEDLNRRYRISGNQGSIDFVADRALNGIQKFSPFIKYKSLRIRMQLLSFYMIIKVINYIKLFAAGDAKIGYFRSLYLRVIIFLLRYVKSEVMRCPDVIFMLY